MRQQLALTDSVATGLRKAVDAGELDIHPVNSPPMHGRRRRQAEAPLVRPPVRRCSPAASVSTLKQASNEEQSNETCLNKSRRCQSLCVALLFATGFLFAKAIVLGKTILTTIS